MDRISGHSQVLVQHCRVPPVGPVFQTRLGGGHEDEEDTGPSIHGHCFTHDQSWIDDVYAPPFFLSLPLPYLTFVYFFCLVVT